MKFYIMGVLNRKILPCAHEQDQNRPLQVDVERLACLVEFRRWIPAVVALLASIPLRLSA